LICCILSNSAVYLPLQTSTQVNMVLLYNFHGSVLWHAGNYNSQVYSSFFVSVEFSAKNH
jgi:hypothetical protein